jgi:hypothetical protein
MRPQRLSSSGLCRHQASLKIEPSQPVDMSRKVSRAEAPPNTDAADEAGGTVASTKVPLARAGGSDAGASQLIRGVRRTWEPMRESRRR